MSALVSRAESRNVERSYRSREASRYASNLTWSGHPRRVTPASGLHTSRRLLAPVATARAHVHKISKQYIPSKITV
ncbi:unnamed protein product [Arctia plantaginis]|uniref:Uncharacterized protein n=1 Tax=Arctia plantaginis TaxID=874455 RepID=A0A8S0ZE39_ARCPL|nr:unnamed protein product [Arctia plantaginis]